MKENGSLSAKGPFPNRALRGCLRRSQGGGSRLSCFVKTVKLNNDSRVNAKTNRSFSPSKKKSLRRTISPLPPWGRDFIAATIIFLLLTSCQPEARHFPPQTTFYHWQTRLAPDSTARALLAEYNCDRLYVKAFDLAWADGQAEPTALIELTDTSGLPALVPVVFLTNEVFLNHPPQLLDSLANDVLGLVAELLGPNFPELQIDCDWTARTRVPYFAFLQALRERLATTPLTCTVRLHQYRDVATQGVPPVNRATLMAYNVGDLNDWATENSIVDTNVVKNYLVGAAPYPLDLDLAVAVYDWAAVYRREELAYLINEPDLTELADTSRFESFDPGWRISRSDGTASPSDREVLHPDDSHRWRVRRSTYFDGIYLYENDLLRHEVAPPDLLAAQLKLLERYVPGFAGRRVMVYRLGARLWE